MLNRPVMTSGASLLQICEKQIKS